MYRDYEKKIHLQLKMFSPRDVVEKKKINYNVM